MFQVVLAMIVSERRNGKGDDGKVVNFYSQSSSFTEDWHVNLGLGKCQNFLCSGVGLRRF